MAISFAASTAGVTSRGTAPRILAIVVAHNGRRYLGACLRSLFVAEPGIEAVVVDNASTDGTAELVRREFPEVRLLALADNVGYGAAGNLGAGGAEADYLAILNQDLQARPGWIGRLVAALEADAATALAAPTILLARDFGRVNARGNAVHYTGLTTCRAYNRPADERDGGRIAAVSGAAFVIRRTAFEALGGFDPLFFLYLEDTDLSLRAALAGQSCRLVAEAEVVHDFAPRFSAAKLGYLSRNRLAMLLKLYRWRTLLVLGPGLLLAEALVLGYSLLRGPRCLAASLGAYAWLAGRLPRVLEARRRAQAARRVSDRALLAGFESGLDLAELGHPLDGLAMRLANPLFRAWYRLVLAVVRW